MAIIVKSVKCPDCGANLPVEEGRNVFFCSYCGGKVVVTNENEYIHRHIDEAEVKRAETEQIIRLKELEAAEREKIAAEKAKKTKLKISLVLAIIGAICMVLGFTFYISPNLSGLAILGVLLLIGAGLIWKKPKKKKEEP